MSGFNYAASISAAYASSDALPHPHARLASGRWLAFTGWESNPLDSIEKFLPVTSDFLLSQAYPGASLESSNPPGRVLTTDQYHCAEVLNFFQSRVEVRDQIIRVLNTD